MDVRQERGRLLAQDKRIKHVEGVMWFVPSQAEGGGGYLVKIPEGKSRRSVVLRRPVEEES